MMTGAVLPYRTIVLRIIVLGVAGRSLEVDALVDTGFNGYLTLAHRDIERSALPFQSHITGVLANNARVRLARYRAKVLWHETERRVMVVEGDGVPLLGMSLLWGSSLLCDAKTGGKFTIQPLA